MLTPTCLRSVSRRLLQLQATPWRATSFCVRCELSLQDLAPVHILASAKHLKMSRKFASTCLGLDIIGIATAILVSKGLPVSDRLQRAAIIRNKACYCASAQHCTIWRLSLTGGLPAQIENATYPVNVEALNTVFSPYGFVQKIAIFEKNGQTQVRRAQCMRCSYKCVLVLP